MWLDWSSRAPDGRGFGVVDLTERGELSSQVKDHVGELLRDARFRPEVLERQAARLGWNRMRTRLKPPDDERGKRGEWGESLFYGISEEFDGYELPVKKLRYKLALKQSLPGTDIIAFRLNTDLDIAEVALIECKLRCTADLRAGIGAYRQLLEDYQEGFADILAFVDEVTSMSDSTFSEAFRRYLVNRDDVSGIETYHLALAFDTSIWDERILGLLDGEQLELDPLRVCALRIERLAQVIEETYAHMGIRRVSGEDDD